MIINIDGGNGGGGGGSYVLPIASASVLGGVKVGSGLTIDNTGRLSTEGGSAGDGNYLIVDALSAVTEPSEGLLVYVRPTSAVSESVKLYITDIENFPKSENDRPEGYLGFIKPEEGEDAMACYISGENLHWDYANNGNWNDREHAGMTFRYRTHNIDGYGGAWIEFILPEGLRVDPVEYVGTAITQETVITEPERYIYKQGKWVSLYGSNFLYIEDCRNPDTGAVISFRELILSNPSDNYYIELNTDRYSTDHHERLYLSEFYGGDPTFNYDLGEGRRRGFALNARGRVQEVHDDYVPIPGQHNISINASGDVTDTYSLYGLSSEQIYNKVLRYNGPNDGEWSQGPVKYVWRRWEEIGGETKLVYYFIAEIMINGTLYRGSWHFIEYEIQTETLAPDTWDVVTA